MNAARALARLLPIVLLAAASGFAQTTSIILTSVGSGNIALTNGQLCLIPVTPTGQPQTFSANGNLYVAGDVTHVQGGFCGPVIGGSLQAALSVPDRTSATSAFPLCYEEVFVDGRGRVSDLGTRCDITGTTVSLNAYVPPTVTPFAVSGYTVGAGVPTSCGSGALRLNTTNNHLLSCGTDSVFHDLTGAGGGTNDYNALLNRPTLAQVATTGNYGDLDGKPTLTVAATTSTDGNLIDVTASPYFASPYGATVPTTSAAVASGATVVPLSSAATFLAGNGVHVTGGGTTGWTGTDYIGKVVSVSGSSITVAPPLSAAVASGALVEHDDVAALNAIAAYCAPPRDCKVFFPGISGTNYGLYRINGPLLDTANSNAMVVLPNQPLSGGTGNTFEMFGPTRPISDSNGVEIVTEYAGTGGNIFGVKVPGAPYGGMSNTLVVLRNLRFYATGSATPTYNIFNCSFCKAAVLEGSVHFNGAAGPFPSSGATGSAFLMPVISNEVDESIATAITNGFGTGITLSEHSTAQQIRVANSFCGIMLDSRTGNSGVTGHANTIHIQNAWTQLVTNMFCAGTTPQNVYVASADMEVGQYLVNDPNSMLTGQINYHIPYDDGRSPQTMAGPPRVIGANKLRLVNLDTGVCYGSTCPSTSSSGGTGGAGGTAATGSNCSTTSTTQTANLIYRWPGVDNSGTSEAECVSGNNLALAGSSWITDSYLGTMPSFTGTSGSGGLSANNANANFSHTSSFSVSAWVNPTSIATAQYIASTISSSDGGKYQGWSLLAGNSGSVAVQLIGDNNAGSAMQCATANNVMQPAGTTQMVTFTYDGSQTAAGVKVYVNNTALAVTCSGTLSSTMANSNGKIGIGRTLGTDAPFAGSLGQVRIYNAVLSSGAVSTKFSNRD